MQDELVLGGLMLYRATSNSYFLRRAENYFNRYNVGENRDPVDWDAKHGLCMLLGSQLVQQNNVTSKVDWLGNLIPYLDEVALKQGKTAGGLLYWPGASDENSLPPAVGMSYLLGEFARLFPKNEKAAEVQALADSQTDYVFGKNPKGNTYVVGISSKSPVNPQVSRDGLFIQAMANPMPFAECHGLWRQRYWQRRPFAWDYGSCLVWWNGRRPSKGR